MRAVIAVLVLVSGLHAALWGLLRDEQQAPDFRGMLPSLSYAPFEGTSNPDVDNVPNVERIRADLKMLSKVTRAIRLRPNRSRAGEPLRCRVEAWRIVSRHNTWSGNLQGTGG